MKSRREIGCRRHHNAPDRQCHREEVSADPAGDVLGSNMRVRTGVEKRSAEDIAGIVLRSNGDGSKLTIGDVALLRDEGIDRLRSFYVGDNQAITCA